MIGRVYLVGAGPGDPELLTIKALRTLGEADLVLHDDLVPAPILNLAAPSAEIVNVGKRCGRKSVNQQGINARMVAGARQGLTVVRLKGGDPSMFGRGGEEIQALREAGVEFEIVPGVTAASAAAAAARISLTHRDLASSVMFLSGHRGAGVRSGWAPLESVRDGAKGRTLVIYMPGPDYGLLQDQLRRVGVTDESPCLLVSAASRSGSRTHQTVLAKLLEAPSLPAPSILIVGDVVRLADEANAAQHPWPSELSSIFARHPVAISQLTETGRREVPVPLAP